MTEPVVDALEIVNVHNGKGQRLAEMGVLQFSVGYILKPDFVIQSSQLVVIGFGLKRVDKMSVWPSTW